MNEINRILAQLEKENTWFNQTDLDMIKQAMVKAAVAAITEGGVALSVCAYVEKEMKDVK